MSSWEAISATTAEHTVPHSMRRCPLRLHPCPPCTRRCLICPPLTHKASVPLDARLPNPCPCSTFTACHPNQQAQRTTPFYQISDTPESWYNFPVTAQKSVDSLQAFDAAPNVLVCIAHEVGLLPILTFFPKGTINDWQSKGWKEATTWGFVNELPVDGKLGRPMLVDGLYRDGKVVGGGPEVLKQYS